MDATLALDAPRLISNFLSAASEVDASVWRAIAGAAVKIPAINSYVYYFPQGHLEQLSPSYFNDFINYNFTLMRPWIPCQVLSIRFLSNPYSDQAFVKFLLQPLQPLGPRPRDDGKDDEYDNHDVVSFAKVLTRSDANNGGGFSVPRYCADMIFPQLDYTDDPPVQNLVLRDTHNVAWEFRHIYRGTPRRHLLTTGWSKFVNAKDLVAGDSVVFIRRKSTNELFVGVRKAQSSGIADGDDPGEALEAIETAVRGMPFEVVYYPKVGFPDFVVKAEKVKEALRMSWNAGTRVRMAVETDDSSRLTWIQGVIAAVIMPEIGMWRGSPWRMLQISWDDPEISQTVKRVNPWQVEDIPFTPILEPHYPPSKKLKALPEHSGMLPNEERPYTLLSHSMAGHLSFNYQYPFSSGIQGACRQDHISTSTSTSSLSTINGDKHHQPTNELPRNGGSEQEPITIIVSPASQSSVQLSAGSFSSFQLFGKIIEIYKAGDGGANPNAEGTSVRRE